MKYLFKVWLKGYGVDQYQIVIAESFTAVEAHYFLHHMSDNIKQIERDRFAVEVA